MSPERWQRIQDLFAAAIDCEGDARGQLLGDRCAGDLELLQEVETMLAAHEQTGAVDRLADAVGRVAAQTRVRTVGWEGAQVGPYAVLDLLGTGGMGLVYKARDSRLARHVALKFLPPHLSSETTAKNRFLNEARAAAALDHPNICTIHEIGETDDGQLFIAMPLYDGETLQARLVRGRLPFANAVPIVVQIARGLARAHERGIVHRDIKPSNIMLLDDGGVKILDFGIAKMDDVSLTGHGAPIGTIAYMSPEHVRGGTVDHRGDIWSLGILIHEMLTGARPFAGDSREQIANAVLTHEPNLSTTAHPDVPAAVEQIVGRALAKLPAQRHSSVSMLAAELTALTGAGISGASAFGTRAQEIDTLPATERRRAAVLVTTVSEYALLLEHMAPVEVHRLLSTIRDIAVEVVRRHGGLVNQAIGEEIVSLFGVPTAHEDDEVRAVRAALELHGRVRELNADASSMIVRIQSGLHVGPVVAERLNEGPRRYAIVGAPGQVASRLASLAGPDRLVVSPECHRLVAPFVHAAPSATVALDSSAQPVTPFCVTGVTGLETRLQASEQSGLTPYVGRQSELGLLETYVEHARAGEGRVITVVGDAGAGKSRLLHELRERIAVAGDIRVLQGRCRAYGDVTPYFPFIEILHDVLTMPAQAIGDSRDIVARLRAIDTSLEPFIPLYLHLLSVPGESHQLPRHLQGEHLQAALIDALASLVVALAGRTPLLVMLEDWHWADAASRAALGRIVEIVTAHSLVVVVTTRPEHGSLDEWLAHGTRIQLEPLDSAASIAIMQAVLRVERVSGSLARRVSERTGGNPFFLEQVCCALGEQGVVVVKDGEALVEGGSDAVALPETVQAVIRTRLDNLEPHAREVLRVASVAGREFEHALLADVLGPSIDLVAAIARLKASGLIQQTSMLPEVSYRFKHVLTQEVSYESLLGHQRTSLHDAIGRAIERHHADRLDEQAALLAYHFGRAEAWQKAVHYGRRAADRANALSQFAEGLAALDQVLAWLPHLADDEACRNMRADVLLQQERAYETLGLRRRQQEIIGQLIAHFAPRGASVRLAQTYLREGDLLTLLKRFSAADRALSTALRISRELGDAALERHTLRSIGLLRWHEGRHDDALAITEHALSIDRAHHDELGVAGDLTNLGNILKGMGQYDAAIPRLEEALAMPALADDPKKLAYALHSLASVHRMMGDLDLALTYLRQADETSRTHLLPIQRSFHLTSIAHIDLEQGRIDDALRTYREAIALSRRARHAEGLAQSLRTLGEVLFGLGHGEEALPYLQEAAHLFAQLEDAQAEAEMRSREAAIFERAKRPAESVVAWERVRTLSQQIGDNQRLLNALEGIARATRQLDASSPDVVAAFEAALDLASTLAEGRRALTLRNALGILEWNRGCYADALRHYEAALLLVRDAGDRKQEALILNSLGVTLTRLQRPDEARTALEESILVCRASGERLLEAHALAALGQVCRSIEQLERAAHHFGQSLELRRELGDRVGEGWMLYRIAETHTALGNESAARDATAAAATIARETQDANLLTACGAPPQPL
jgi:tetratricopeptide (TPR) repeat protein/class 3 adenylate cyclase/tRNA A-37 threonylcarbamoyl transferase component Bud32